VKPPKEPPQTRPPRVALWLGILAAIGLIGTYVGLVPLPIPEALAIGAVVAAIVRRQKIR